jgi:hypothetical protein
MRIGQGSAVEHISELSQLPDTEKMPKMPSPGDERLPSLPALLGPVRILLLAVVALCIVLVPFSDARPQGWGIVPAYLAPVAVMLSFFILLLDMMMNRIFMSDKPEEQKAVHRHIIRIELVALVVMMLAWSPFFYGLLTV